MSLGPSSVDQERNIIDQVEADFVAAGYRIAESNAALSGALDPVAERSAALENQSHLSFFQKRRRGRERPQSFADGIGAHAVRAAKHHARALAKIFHRLRAFLSFFIVTLAEAGGVNRSRARAQLGGLFQNAEKGAGRNQYQKLIRNFRECREIRIAPVAVKFLVVRIDQVHPAGILRAL